MFDSYGPLPYEFDRDILSPTGKNGLTPIIPTLEYPTLARGVNPPDQNHHRRLRGEPCEGGQGLQRRADCKISLYEHLDSVRDECAGDDLHTPRVGAQPEWSGARRRCFC